jgi:hypothetical protein
MQWASGYKLIPTVKRLNDFCIVLGLNVDESAIANYLTVYKLAGLTVVM